jgi:hypothetical protein
MAPGSGHISPAQLLLFLGLAQLSSASLCDVSSGCDCELNIVNPPLLP